MPILFPYQEVGRDFLASGRYRILGDEMGVGKSAQAIAAADLIGAQKIIVVCMAVARENWKNEFKRFSTIDREYHLFFNTQYRDIAPKSVTICSYETVECILKKGVDNFDLAIIDECHSLKEPKAKRTQNILGKNGLIRRCKYFWELSGTITPNHYGELWTHLFTFGQTELSYDQFLKKFCVTRETSFGMQISGSTKDNKKILELKQMLRPIFLRRTVEDAALNLPDISFENIVVQPGKVDLSLSKKFQPWIEPEDRVAELNAIIEKQFGIYKAITDNEFKEEVIPALAAAANSISSARAYVGLQKIQPVFDLVTSEIQNNAYEKIVIFAHHRDVIEALEAKFKYQGLKVVKVYGGSDPKKIQQRIEEFQDRSSCRIFLGNILASGTSITLTAAHHVLFIEQEWVPGKNAQALKRCHRIGQTKPVFVRVVSLANSLDQYVNSLLLRKSSEIEMLMDDDGNIKPKTILKSARQPQKVEPDIESLI